MRTGFVDSKGFFYWGLWRDVLQAGLQIDAAFSSSLRSARETKVLLMDPTRNSVSQVMSRFCGEVGFADAAAPEDWPLETRAMPAPGRVRIEDFSCGGLKFFERLGWGVRLFSAGDC